MKKLLIIPDVHGRSFWRSAVEKEKTKTIFLGDYVDPYSWEGFTRADAIKALEDVIELKKERGDDIVLLLGNHDYQYLEDGATSSRYDYEGAPKIKKLLIDNLELFDLAHLEENYLFSHSGITKPWVKFSNRILGDDPDIKEIPGILNDLLHKNKEKLESILLSISYYRGGFRGEHGSIIWGDVREIGSDPESMLYPEVYQIFGHTQLEKDPIIKEKYACLDCRKAFILENGKIKEMEVKDE